MLAAEHTKSALSLPRPCPFRGRSTYSQPATYFPTLATEPSCPSRYGSGVVRQCRHPLRPPQPCCPPKTLDIELCELVPHRTTSLTPCNTMSYKLANNIAQLLKLQISEYPRRRGYNPLFCKELGNTCNPLLCMELGGQRDSGSTSRRLRLTTSANVNRDRDAVYYLAWVADSWVR